MIDVPQEWIDAAMAVLGNGEWDRTHYDGCDYWERVAERQGLLAIALEAVAPLVAAAERERIAQLAIAHRAHYGCYIAIESGSAPVVTSGLRPFADLIRDSP